MGIKAGVNGVVKEASAGKVGVGGVVRTVSEGWCGSDGVLHQFSGNKLAHSTKLKIEIASSLVNDGGTYVDLYVDGIKIETLYANNSYSETYYVPDLYVETPYKIRFDPQLGGMYLDRYETCSVKIVEGEEGYRDITIELTITGENPSIFVYAAD